MHYLQYHCCLCHKPILTSRLDYLNLDLSSHWHCKYNHNYHLIYQ
nr:MAG TPA: Vacuolar sorting protein 39 domain 2 [Caudoviricetes sp.]